MPQDRQTKLDTTISSVSPEAMERTRQEVDAARMKLDEHDSAIFIEPADLISEPPTPPPLPGEKDRLDKLQVIQDVQLILVDKYKQGWKLMIGAFILLLVGTVGIGGIYLKNAALYDQMVALQDEQRRFNESQHKIVASQETLEKKTDAAKDLAEETKKKVDAAVESQPKIEVDAQGRPKLVVPVSSAAPKRTPVTTIPVVEPKKK